MKKMLKEMHIIDAIKTTGLSKRYENKMAVNQLNISVPQGAIYGFIGRNGSGKSTTQKMVCGLINPTDGNVQLFGKPISDETVRRKIGTLIEEPGIYPRMSTLSNVIMQGYNIGIEKPKEKAIKALETVGLKKEINKKAKNLSLGMKQRLGLAIAMLGEPEILVLDEPINGLDPEGIVQFRQVIEKLNREKGVTIFISSHILGELSKIATHYGIIENGELIEQITAEELSGKRKTRMVVIVNNPKKALVLLKEVLHTEQYEMTSDGEIHLFDINDPTKVNKLLSKNDFNIREIYFHKQDLEEYFIELMGGSDYE